MWWLSLALAAPIAWRDLDADALAEARASNKLVLIDVGAVWCHWCHVMDATTWQDRRVQKALAKRFIAVRVDQDAEPDLSRRYRDHGWPALVVFDPDTLEDRAIGSGYHDPDELLALLDAGRDGTAAPVRVAEPGGATLTDAQRDNLLARLDGRYDPVQGGWGRQHKFVPWRNIGWLLTRDDPESRRRVEQTLDAGRALIDPVWGGVYQYSTHGDWEHAHFEKILRFEAEIGAIYAEAHRVYGRPEDLAAARDILRHVTTFLDAPEGGFHPSQDADRIPGEHSAGYFALDDAGRRALGIPRVDPAVYAGETAMAVTALVALWRASGDPEPLDRAARAGDWLLTARVQADGRVARDADSTESFLADHVEAARGFVALHGATGDRRWLDAAVRTLDAAEGRLRAPDAGYLAGEARPDRPAPIRDRDENVSLARVADLVGHATGAPRFRAMAEHAMRFVGTEPALAAFGWHVGGALQADAELSRAPAHVVVVGQGPAADALFAATRTFGPHTVFERLAVGEPGANGVRYPELDAPAAFFCADGRCSPPITDPTELSAR